MKTAAGFIVLAMCMLLCAPQAKGFSDETHTLQGVKAFMVLVDSLDKDAIRCGLTVDRLRTDVELKLRQNGLPLLTYGQKAGPYYQPFLDLMVGGLVDGNGQSFVYTVSLELMQYVGRMEWDTTSHPDPFCYAATWKRQWIGVTGVDGCEKAVRQAVLEGLDYFLKDWLAVNGPNAKSKSKDGKE